MVHRLVRPVAYLGALGIVLGLSKLHASQVADVPYDLTSSSRFAWAVAYSIALAVAAYGLGLPDEVHSWREALGRSLVAAATAALAVSSVQLVVGDALLPRLVVFGAALACVPWWMLCAWVAAGGRARELDRDRVVLVADAVEVTAVADELAASPEHPASIVATLDPHEVMAGPLHGREIEAAVRRTGATVVVLDRAATEEEAIVAQVARLHGRGVRVRTLSMFYGQWFGKLPLRDLERVSLLFDIGEVHSSSYGRLKRLLDVVLSLVGLVALVLVLPIVAVGDLVANRGPLFYRQLRIGKGGEPFEIIKLRTMRPDGEDDTHWTSDDDDRITPFGRWLRTSHLDELPQVLNVLRGDLSIVGPRPEQPVYVEELAEKLPFYEVRHLVRPGLTGWAQVKYPYGADLHDALEKLQYEFWYLRNQGLMVDLRIVGRTIRSVFGRHGR